MPQLTIGLGVLLVAIGSIAFIATSFASWTALIPAMLGAVILVAGLISLKKQKLGVHLALAVAVLGVLGTSRNVMQLDALIAREAERPTAVLISTITFALLIFYVGLGIHSFVAARRWKTAET